MITISRNQVPSSWGASPQLNIGIAEQVDTNATVGDLGITRCIGTDEVSLNHAVGAIDKNAIGNVPGNQVSQVWRGATDDMTVPGTPVFEGNAPYAIRDGCVSRGIRSYAIPLNGRARSKKSDEQAILLIPGKQIVLDVVTNPI